MSNSVLCRRTEPRPCVLKTGRNLPDEEGRKGDLYGDVGASESWHQEKDLKTSEERTREVMSRMQKQSRQVSSF